MSSIAFDSDEVRGDAGSLFRFSSFPTRFTVTLRAPPHRGCIQGAAGAPLSQRDT